ncbi:MAG: c-type cytochrome [Rhodocyclaceae bacterium]|nr:c-type cytochrome [Rhodocyclaceae bacterium]
MKSYRRTLLVSAVAVGLSFAGYATAADIAKLEETCASCHGKDGASAESDVPIIGGISATYIEFNLADYKTKARPCPEAKIKTGTNKGKKTDMCEVAKTLSDSDIKQLAKYYAGKKFVRAVQTFDPKLAKAGKAVHLGNCEKCHANDGTEVKDDAGVLAGQWTPYLRKTFQEYRAGKRHMEQKMEPVIQGLKNDDFEALLNYYASIK